MASSCNRKTNPSVQPPKAAAPSKTAFKPKCERGGGNASPVFFGMDDAPDLAFFAQVGNNLFVTCMRFACGLAIALWLSFPAAGMASRQQEPAGSANAAGQVPAPPAAPAETTPTEKSPAPAEKPQTEHAPAEQFPPETRPA